jgi:hypothetical protein
VSTPKTCEHGIRVTGYAVASIPAIVPNERGIE